MKTPKKSQITMLMILGIMIFLVVSLILYFSKSTIKNKLNTNIKKSQEASLNTQPIKEFVTKCLDKLSKDAVILLGQQGGYIYKSQGGNLIDYKNTDEGTYFVRYNNFNVAYNLLPPKFEVQTYSSKIPDYPWQIFPYKTINLNEESYEGYFGINNMPPLNSSEGPNSIKTQIETFIDNKMPDCLDFSIFEEQGFNIVMNSTNTSVVIGASDISIISKIPITISNPTTREITQLSDFSTHLEVRLKDIYFFTKELIYNDIKNIKFNISYTRNNKDSLKIQLIENIFSNDDLVIVTDEKSLISGKQYQYIFSRKNRAPALYYITQTTLEFPQGYEIKLEDLLQGSTLSAIDTDEDNYIFTITPTLPYTLNVPQKEFKIEVSDGKLIDYQIITVNRV